MSNVPETARLPALLASGMRTRHDDTRLRALVDHHVDLASRIIRNLGIPDCDVDDLLQQAFSITADRLGDITPGKERAFLIQTAIRLAVFPNSCPVSRRRYKNDIHYLSPAELARYRDELLAMKLATWRYKHDPLKERLGFMIDDNEDSAAADAKRDVVDLYGYTSMAVATIQLQARQIEALEREVAAMKKNQAQPPSPRPSHINAR